MNKEVILVIILILIPSPFIYGFIERLWVQIKTYSVDVKKKDLNGLKIVFLSDLHYSRYIPISYIRKVIKKVNLLSPDIILLGGDYISYDGRLTDTIVKELKNLKAKVGLYAVLGNHDVLVNKKKMLETFRKYDIKILDNESVGLNKGLNRLIIGGVSDYLLDHPNIEPIVKDVLDDDYVIVVSHNPDYFEKVKDEKIDLMLSGHTHGGQITFFGLYAPVNPSKYNFLKGLIKVNNKTLIISNGVGCVGLPFRFFARPQIVVINLV